ncbi:MAG: DUF839 domain-containing protein [Burkholderiales bacterium]|nr:DUF839 domain-containing protein [Burkholderiales bacterium]
MEGINHPRNSESLNPSTNESIRDVSDRLAEGRRHFLKSSLGAATLSALGGVTLGGFMRSVEAAPIPPGPGFAGIGFEGIAPNLFNADLGRLQNDPVSVPGGYRVEILSAWGDPIMPGASDWDPTATQDAAAQEKQVGMHHDGIHFFAFPARGSGASAGLSNERGLLRAGRGQRVDEGEEGPDHADRVDRHRRGAPGRLEPWRQRLLEPWQDVRRRGRRLLAGWRTGRDGVRPWRPAGQGHRRGHELRPGLHLRRALRLSAAAVHCRLRFERQPA